MLSSAAIVGVVQCVPISCNSVIDSILHVHECIGDFMHELSNDGARDQFESLLATVIVPAMIKCAKVRIM